MHFCTVSQSVSIFFIQKDDLKRKGIKDIPDLLCRAYDCAIAAIAKKQTSFSWSKDKGAVRALVDTQLTNEVQDK